jgi:hypothetical protein
VEVTHARDLNRSTAALHATSESGCEALFRKAGPPISANRTELGGGR